MRFSTFGLAFFLALISTPTLAESRIDGLLTFDPESHAAIAAGNCLGENGFRECKSVLIEAGAQVKYSAYVIEDSMLLTKYYVYAEECRGAATPEDITGWCGRRDEVKAQLDMNGICLRDAGFVTCPAALGD